ARGWPPARASPNRQYSPPAEPVALRAVADVAGGRRSDDRPLPASLRDAPAALLRADRFRDRRGGPCGRRLGARYQARLGRAGLSGAWTAAAPERGARTDRNHAARARPARGAADTHLHGRTAAAHLHDRAGRAGGARTLGRAAAGAAACSIGSSAMNRATSILAAALLSVAAQGGIPAGPPRLAVAAPA